MLKYMLFALLIFVILTIAFASMQDITDEPSDLGEKTSVLTELVQPPMFSADIINPIAWVNYGKALKTVLTIDYPNVLTGNIGGLVRYIMLVFEIISFITLVVFINAIIRGSLLASWS